MSRVVLVSDEASTLEHIGHALDTLPGEAQRPGDLGDGRRRILDHRQHLPPGGGLARRSGERVTLRRDESVQAEQADDKPAEGVASRSPVARIEPGFVDSMLSFWYATHDSILSYQSQDASIREALMDWKLELISVPVSDVDRAKTFYAEKVGFNLDHDHVVSDAIRFVQLTPRGSACSIAIGTGISDAVPGSARGLQIVVTDAAAAREELLGRGVEASDVQEFPWGKFVFFSDPDGNGWALQEMNHP